MPELKPIPPDPEPTDCELAPYLAAETSRPEVREAMAAIKWKMDRQKEDPNAFLVPFVGWIRNFDYDAYLKSEGWQAIRQKKLESAGRRCECCSRRATQVHHRDYRPRVLSGEDLSPLVALCEPCHHVVEYDDKGRKLDTWQDKERILAELMKRKGRALQRKTRKSTYEDRS